MSKTIQFQVLADARLLIDNPQDWCKGTFAIGKGGRPLVSGSPRALKHCAVSAIMLAARRTVADRREADRIAESVIGMMAPAGSDARAAQKYIWGINDSQGHAAVLELFDTALATC
jgi:hypothetical protein